MRIFVHIRDKTYTVSVGAGQQTVEWLANVALLRFDRTGFDHISCRGFKYLEKMLNLAGTIESQMQPDSHCYLLLEGDQGFDDNLGDEPADEEAAKQQQEQQEQQQQQEQQAQESQETPQIEGTNDLLQQQQQLLQQQAGEQPTAAGTTQENNVPKDNQSETIEAPPSEPPASTEAQAAAESPAEQTQEVAPAAEAAPAEASAEAPAATETPEEKPPA